MKESISTFLIFLFCLFVFAAIIAFKKWHEYSHERTLKGHVAWSVTGGNGIPLWAEISNAQIKLGIQKDYCISGDQEWEIVKEILQEYRKNLTQSYFNGNLVVIKSKYVIREEHYFMFALYAFLSDHECDYAFLGNDMHKETISYKEYGSWGGALFDATYALTDFAVVFHKMHYISYMYCRGNGILKDFVPDWKENNLKEILDTKQIQVSRF